MRKFVIGLLIFVAVLVGGVAFAVMNVNGLLEENRERLSGIASEAVGRSVEFSKAEVAFSRGLSIRIDGLRISEDPRFGEGEFIALDSAFVDIEIWPALRRELAVSGVRLDRPTIRVISTAEGLNFSSIGGADPDADPDASSPAPESPEPGESENLAIAIAAFQISEGTVLIEDRTADPPLALTIHDFESSGTDLSLEGPVNIAFSGSLRPTAGPAAKQAALTSRFRGRIELADLASGAGGLRIFSQSFHPLLLGVALEEGDVVERIENLDLDIGLPVDAATSGYAISLQSSGGRLGGFDFKNLDVKLRYRGSTAEIKRLVVGVVGGQIELAGDMRFGEANASPFKIDTQLKDLDADELTSILLDLPRGYVSGRIDGDVKLAGDSLEWETLKRSLAGQIDLEMGKGALEKVNLLDDIVARLVKDPGLGQLIATSIRDVTPNSVKGDRTKFDKVNLSLRVADGAVHADTVELEAEDFLVSGLGKAGLDGNLSGKGKLLFSESVSKKIRKKTDGLSALLGDGKRIELPLDLGGTVTSPRLRPDTRSLAAKSRTNVTIELTNKASKALSKVLFGKKKKKKKKAESAKPAEPDTSSAGGD